MEKDKVLVFTQEKVFLFDFVFRARQDFFPIFSLVNQKVGQKTREITEKNNNRPSANITRLVSHVHSRKRVETHVPSIQALPFLGIKNNVLFIVNQFVVVCTVERIKHKCIIYLIFTSYILTKQTCIM